LFIKTKIIPITPIIADIINGELGLFKLKTNCKNSNMKGLENCPKNEKLDIIAKANVASFAYDSVVDSKYNIGDIIPRPNPIINKAITKT